MKAEIKTERDPGHTGATFIHLNTRNQYAYDAIFARILSCTHS